MKQLSIAVVFCCLSIGANAAQEKLAKPVEDIFPGAVWSVADPVSLGWSSEGLRATRNFLATLPPASVVVIDHGRLVAQWGDPRFRIKISSVRKSLLSALFGIYAYKTSFSLDSTLAQLKIDDDPPLTTAERQATVRMLLQARSGVYHGYVAGTPGMREGRPPRGSHEPGTFWFYNNWDFNALGTVFERAFNVPIAQAFLDRIATPIGMEDFRVGDMYYLRAAMDAQPDLNQSVHPAYHFRMSARDLARFGYLFLQGGRWGDAQVVPSGWVAQSTRPYSTVGPQEGYGYLWWVNGLDLPEESFSAQGALAKYMVVIPRKHLVVAYLNHTEFPDDLSGMSAADLKALPTVTREQMSQLLKLLLAAQDSR